MQMKHLFISFLFWSFTSLLVAQQTQWKWAKQYGSFDYENILDIATDAQGNVYGVGYLKQSGSQNHDVIFGSSTFTTSGGTDGFMAKWDSTGNLIWVKQLANAEDASINRVACDSMGNVFIAGSFLGTINVGGVSLNAANTSTNFGNAFWAKINPANGTAVWAKKINLSTNSSSFVTIDALCLDKTGNIYLGGMFETQLKASGTVSVNAAGLKDGYVAQSSSTGQINWVRAYNGGVGDVDEQAVVDLATDNKGSLYVGGYFFNYINIDGTNHYNLENTPFITKMNISSGANTWFQFGSTNTSDFSTTNNNVARLGVDSTGNVYVSGNFGRDITWGTTTLMNKDNTHYYGDFYVVKISNAGVVSWAKSWGGAAFGEFVYDIAVNKDGSYYLAGSYGSATDFGAGSVAAVGGQGYNSAYLAKYTNAGNLTWLRTIGNTTDPENGYFACVAADKFANVLAGSVVETGTFHYDNNVMSSNTNSGNSDIGVAKLRDKTISVTAIEHKMQLLHFAIYPNPATQQFSVSSNDKWAQGKIEIYDISGQKVMNVMMDKNISPISISQLTSGIYFVKIVVEGKEGIEKLVVQ